MAGLGIEPRTIVVRGKHTMHRPSVPPTVTDLCRLMLDRTTRLDDANEPVELHCSHQCRQKF